MQFFRRRREQKALRKALSQLPQDRLLEALGGLLEAQATSTTPRGREDDHGAASLGSEEPHGESLTESQTQVRETQRAKLKATALQYTGSADGWKRLRDMAEWDEKNPTTLANEGELIESLHFEEVEQNPPPQPKPSGENLVRQEISDYDTIYSQLTGRMPNPNLPKAQ